MKKYQLTRREILSLSLAALVLVVFPSLTRAQRKSAKRFNRQSFINARSLIVPHGGTPDASRVKVIRQWNGPICRSRLVNSGPAGVKVKEVVLFDLTLPLPAETRIYGEGFQMLSQSGGTLGKPTDLGNYSDAKHYKLSAPEGSKAFYGLTPHSARLFICT
ncbi:MAG: hypothetical protein ACR2G5_16210 [Pyrinomonadaceae bacterium]